MEFSWGSLRPFLHGYSLLHEHGAEVRDVIAVCHSFISLCLSVSLCLCLSVSFCLFISLSLSLSLSLSHSPSLSLSLTLFLSLSPQI